MGQRMIGIHLESFVDSDAPFYLFVAYKNGEHYQVAVRVDSFGEEDVCREMMEMIVGMERK